MIKINLLPPHILEGRRVKIVAIFMGLLVVLCAAAMIIYIWSPAPFSLTKQVTAKKAELVVDKQKKDDADKVNAAAQQMKSSFQAKQTWVDFVTDADRCPRRWAEWFKNLDRWIPNEVVINGLPLPNGNILTLQGTTSDYRAANRWWLSMLRCNMIDQSVSPWQVVSIGNAEPSLPGHRRQPPHGLSGDDDDCARSQVPRLHKQHAGRALRHGRNRHATRTSGKQPHERSSQPGRSPQRGPERPSARRQDDRQPSGQ